MKYCQSCGESIDDNAVVCPKCGSAQQYSYAQPGQDMSQQYSYAQPVQDMSQQYGYSQYEQEQIYADLGEGISAKKKSSKKPLFIILGILAVTAVAFCIWFFLFHKKSSKDTKQIEEKASIYIEAVGNLDLEKIIELTIPKDILKTLVEEMFIGNLSEFGYDTNAEFEDIYNDFLDEANEYLDSYVSEYNLNVDIKNYDVTSIDKLNIDDIIEALYSADQELEASDTSLREAKALTKEFASEYGIDIDNLYNVYVTVDASFNVDGQSFDFSAATLGAMFSSPSVSMYVPFDIIDKDGGIALFMAYKYEDEYYLIPNIAIFAPQFIKYNAKASISADRSNAMVIYTAIQTVLVNEEYYEFFTGEGSNIIFAITEQGLNELPAECGKELRDILYTNGQLPTPSLKEQGQTHFTFMVDGDGQVYVYIASGANEAQWELMPEQDTLYQ